jgi:translation initiation factor 2 subunit 1
MELAFGEDIDDETYTAVANALLAEFPTLYDAFEDAAIHGEEALADVDLDESDITAIIETARENVSVPYVEVTGYVDLECPSSAGVDVIKEALQAAEGNGEVLASEASEGSEGERSESSGVPEEVDLEVTYVGAPEYRIEVQAPDYKTAESQLEASADRAIAVVRDHDGVAEFHRERREDDE